MEVLDDPNQTRPKTQHDTHAEVTAAGRRGDTLRRHLGALLLAVIGTGCGVVQVKGLPGGSSASSTTPSSSGARTSERGRAADAAGTGTTDGAARRSASNGVTAGSGDAASVAAAYKTFTFGSCDGHDCEYAFRKAAGVTQGQDARGLQTFFNPRSAGKNPDPVWLTGWDALPSDETHTGPVYQALAIAASARSWRARCESDYEVLHAQLTAADQKLDAAIAAANALPTRYERLGTLLALRTDAQADQQAHRELRAEEELRRHAGAPYALELAILDAFRKLDLEYVYFAVPGFKAPARIVEAGRPRGDHAAEREAYCADAIRGYSKLTPALSLWGSRSIEDDWAKVKAPIDTALVEKITEARGAVYAGNKQRFAQATHLDGFSELQQPYGEGGGGGKGKLRHIVTESKVTKVTRSGTKVTVELKGVRESNAPYNCKPTKDIDLDTGRVRQACDVRFVRSDVHLAVTFDDVPASVKIEPGDQLDMFATMTAEREQMISHTAALDKTKDDMTYAGSFLVRAWH
jgi:hypothetical protein